MSHICFRFSVYKNYNIEAIVVSHTYFCFSTCKTYNVEEIASGIPIVDIPLVGALFCFFNCEYYNAGAAAIS